MNRLTGQILLAGIAQSDSDIRYLSGFTAPDPFVFMRVGSKNHLVVSMMEKGRALKQATPGTQVFTPAELGLSGKKAAKTDRQIVALMKEVKIQRIQVPSDFPVAVFKALEKRGVNISIIEGSICPERKTKTRHELAELRKSQYAAVSAMNMAVKQIASAKVDTKNRLRTGRRLLTSEGVRHQIQKTLIDFDCMGIDTIVAGGEQSTDPHERGHGQLYAGQPIIIDIFPRNEKTGYWGDITRTVCRGKAPAELKKLYAAVKSAQAAALRAIRPGLCSDEIHSIAKAVFEQRGYETRKVDGRHVGFIHGTGHGVGLDIHELPRVGTSGEMLDVGHVITIEPGLYYPGLGGVRIEDTVVVTEKGWRYLAPCPKKFELL